MEIIKAIVGIGIALMCLGGMFTCGMLGLAGVAATKAAKGITEAKEQKALNLALMRVEVVDFKGDGNYMTVRGKITNGSTAPADYVKVEARYFDKKGNLIDTDWTYAISGHPLQPGDVKSFEVMTQKAKGVSTVSLNAVQ